MQRNEESELVLENSNVVQWCKEKGGWWRKNQDEDNHKKKRQHDTKSERFGGGESTSTPARHQDPRASRRTEVRGKDQWK